MTEKVIKLRAEQLSSYEYKRGDILFVSDRTISAENSQSVALSNALKEEGFSLFIDNDSPLALGRSSLIRLGNRLRLLSCCKTIHCLSSSLNSFVTTTVPAMILGRFFGRRVIFQISSSELIDKLVGWKVVTLPFLRLAERIVVESRLSAYRLSKLGLNSVIRIAPLHNDKMTRRKVTSVQPRLLVVAPLDNDHNPQCALKAYELVKQKYPRTELTFVGKGSLESFLRSEITKRRLHGVQFLIPKDEQELADIYQASDLFINCASRSAGTQSLVDACFSGLPVVTSDESNAMELIQDKKNGLVFGINEHVALAERIIQLVEFPQVVSELSEQSAILSRKFDWFSVRNDWLALYPQSQ